MTGYALRAAERAVEIPAGMGLSARRLPGTLAWPQHPSGVVLFAHGSGSSRLSPRNQLVARQLRAAGMATLLFDLLTEDEAGVRMLVFDISLLAARLIAATEWVTHQPELEGLPLGYFGASTGAAAALEAAARSDGEVGAVVSRGGRPDLAWDELPQVTVPTLLIVGERDPEVLELNRRAFRRLGGPKRLVVVPRATHLFEEPGTLEEAGKWAAEWFVHYLAMARRWERVKA